MWFLRTFRSWRAGRGEYLHYSRILRQERGGWAYERLRERVSKNNIGVAIVIGVATPIILWQWESRVAHEKVDLVGLLLAAVLPLLAYVMFVWLRAYRQARVYVFRTYKQAHE